jgi:hypothetical protein
VARGCRGGAKDAKLPRLREQVSRFRFVENHQRAVGLKRLCQVPRVSRSGFYRCRSAAPALAARQETEDRLVEGISTIHAESGGAYGDLGCTAAMSVTWPAPVTGASG